MDTYLEQNGYVNDINKDRLHHESYQIQHDCDHKSKEASIHQSLGSITSRKCFYKTDSVKEPTGVDHSDHTADDQ